MRGAIAALARVDLSEVEAIVGQTSFKRGRSFARANRVLRAEFDEKEATLTGAVIGNGGLYAAEALFEIDQNGQLSFRQGDCSCPVGYDCKHVAALVIAATATAARNGASRMSVNGLTVASATRATPPAAPPPTWEASLQQLLGTQAPPATGVPLAIELTLQARGGTQPGALALQARLMRPGANGGWVNGSIYWSGLDTWQVKEARLRDDHLALAREMHAVHRLRAGRPSYYYGSYNADKTLELGGWAANQLWPALDRAAELGVTLIHRAVELPPCRTGELVLDVAAGPGGRRLSAGLRIGDLEQPQLEPLLFLGGDAGHGLVCGDPAEAELDPARRRLQLVRLERPVPPLLQELLLDGGALEVPDAELERFSEEYCPALQRIATVVSADGSFAPPEVSAPALVLRASYGAGHAVEVAWEWAYQVGARQLRTPLAPSAAGAQAFRDLAAERALLAQTSLPHEALAPLGLLDPTGRPAHKPAVRLTGLDSMLLSTETLPALAQVAGLAVELEGEPPDYRDVSGSLEIGVATVEIAGERDWFDLGVTISVEGRELPFAEVFAALARGEARLLLADGAHFSLEASELQALRQLIDEARSLADAPPDALRISRYQTGLWEELAALGVVTAQAQAWQRQVQALKGLDELIAHEPPPTLEAQLRGYQREGFGWLAALWELELGGILADDMGLGKTVQTLALILHARERDPDAGPFLVVAPTSVVSGWVEQAWQFAPGLQIEPVVDTLARSGRTLEQVLAGTDLVITTYTLLRLEADAYKQVPWAGVILDEAQYVKNHQAKTYKSVRELEARIKLAITGTPMENNLMELWSLLSITAPGLFPDPTRFAEHYQRPIERARDGERLARLRRRIRPLVKRRTKELVAADLPAKQEQVLSLDLHPRHRKLYDTRLQRERQRVLGLLDDFDRNRFTILRSLTILRQLSLHAGLVEERSDAVPCAKLQALVEQLDDVVAGGHRALVFSQFTGFLAKVRDRLDEHGIEYCYLDGKTRRRERVLEQWRGGDAPVFLISLKAGGFGLNLTEADYCFLLDPWWNPATEAQAIDRTHRIGQTRPVIVYRLIARNTIEEKVVALAQRKAELFRGVMDEGDIFSGAITAEDIRGLLG